MLQLKSLYINLVEEEQVDFVMRYIQNIEFLNGLPVEKKLKTIPQSEHTFEKSGEKSMEEVIEEPSKDEEDSQGQVNDLGDLESSGSEFQRESNPININTNTADTKRESNYDTFGNNDADQQNAPR